MSHLDELRARRKHRALNPPLEVLLAVGLTLAKDSALRASNIASMKEKMMADVASRRSERKAKIALASAPVDREARRNAIVAQKQANAATQKMSAVDRKAMRSKPVVREQAHPVSLRQLKPVEPDAEHPAQEATDEHKLLLQKHKLRMEQIRANAHAPKPHIVLDDIGDAPTDVPV